MTEYTITKHGPRAEMFGPSLRDRVVDWLQPGLASAIGKALIEIEQLKLLRTEDAKLILQLASELNDLKNQIRDSLTPQQKEQYSSGRPLNRGNARTFVAERPRQGA